MADYVFPDGTLDDRHRLLSLLGGFWSRTYEGNELVASLLLARAQEEQQTHQDYRELVAALSRFTVPVLHTDHWYELRVLQSELETRPLRYGDGAVYGPQDASLVTYTYGGNSAPLQQRIPLPTDIREVPLIVNRITAPSLTLVHGLDYVLDDGALVLTRDLFADDRVPKEPIYTGSEVTDQALTLWLVRSGWDWKYLYNHFGYLISGPKNSTPVYRDFINAVLDALAGGTTQADLEAVFAAVTGNPVARGNETVEYVGRDRNQLLVITDQNVYRFQASATAMVTAGDVLTAGQQLTSAVTFYDFTQGEVPEGLLSLYLDTPFLLDGFAGGLSFPNREVPLVVEEDVDGKTKISFELGGYPTDVESFFQQLHARPGALGQSTLAELLDLRGPGQSTQPTAASLPATLNPCQFLVANVLRFHFAAVQIQVAASQGDFSLIDARVLRRLVPPWQALLLLLDLDTGSDLVDPDSVLEEGELFSAAEPGGDVIDPATYVSEAGQMFYLECLCE